MKNLLLSLAILAVTPAAVQAQRIYQKMGRGVVAVTRNGGTNCTVSWRKLTNDPDSCSYNLYKRAKGTTTYSKINTSPLRGTNIKLSLSQLPYDSEVAVTTVAKDGTEGEMSVPFLYSKKPYNNEWMHIEFDDNVLKRNEYSTKYVWPCDLNGDGEMNEFIVDRLGAGGFDDAEGDDEGTETTASNHKLQAYDINGTLLWTIALGPNVNIDAGQADMVTVCDIDCDGKTEVIIKSSDGTRFWDKKNETWGKYVFGKDTGDTDGDGIIDYCVSTNTKRNPPFYISVIDGMTGEEKVSAELNYAEVHDSGDQYSRDNKDSYMGNKGYYQMTGMFAICYDGVRPYVTMLCADRELSGTHHYYQFSFGYDWVNGKPSNFHHFATWARNDARPHAAEYHGNRVADVDGDGIDELCHGGFAANPWKGLVSSPGIGHGDRYTITDIDPERPGMEVYAIQQSSLLGQLIWDAATGERIKEWYLPEVFDVGRGQCCDLDSTRLGLENYSFVSDYVYDCKGKKTDIKRPYPNEPMWWDGDLLRESLTQIGGSGRGSNMVVAKLPNTGQRFINFGSESEWNVHGQTGSRPGFFGDIFGDWREEVILMIQKQDTSTGIAGYATELTTDKTITALYEDGHYRGDCSARGYYQSPNPSFYLAHGMPQEPIYDCVEADLRWKGGAFDNGFTSFDQTKTMAYADGKSVIFDISGQNNAEISLNKAIAPSALYLMSPKGHDYTFSGTGSINGAVMIKKGMQGKTTLNIDITSTEKAVISEGTLEANANINCPLYLMARGTLAGTATINAPVYFEGALNYAGCRIMPGNANDKLGVMTFNKDLTLPGKVYIETTLSTAEGKAAIVKVNGDLTLKGTNYFTIDCIDSEIKAGSYTLAECTGTLTANAEEIKVRNLNGVPYRIVIEGKKIMLTIDAQRKPADGVMWKGGNTTEWDYLTKNFSTGGEDSYFVTGDKVVFDDSADNFDISLNGTVIAGSMEFRNNEKTYTISGEGNLSGAGDLIKNGKGEVKLFAEGSDFTGRTIINEGRLTVSKMADAGKTSSLGAPVADKGYLQINGAELAIDGDNTATNRMITIADTSYIDVMNAGSSLTMNNQISGDGVLVKKGKGQLNFSYAGENTFNAIVVREGIINQGVWNTSFGKIGCPMYLEGGTVALRANNGMTTTPDLNHAFYAKEGTESNIKGSFRSNVSGSMHGKGTIRFTSGGARCYLRADLSDFDGTLLSDGAELLLTDVVTDMKRATLKPTGSCSVSPAASTLNVGTLASDDKEAKIGGTTVNVGYKNEDSKFAGIISCKSFYKYGTGTLTLNGTSSTAGIYVKEGAIRLSNISGNCTTASITVDGGKLMGSGGTQSLLVKNGAVIAPGTDSATGTITTAGNMICYGKTTLSFNAGASINSKLRVKGTFRMNGDTIRINPIAGRTFAEGDEIKIIDAATFYAGSKWTIVDDTYLWDDTKLISDGILICKGNATGVKGIYVNEPDNVRYFTTDGKEISAANLAGHHTYIRRTVTAGKVETIVINK